MGSAPCSFGVMSVMAKKRPPAFDPKSQPFKTTTLARQVARQNLTRLNNAFWVTEHSHSLVRGSFSVLAFPSGPTDHGCYGSAPQWEMATDDQLAWVRQHVLLSAASLLEVYLSSAILAALWANPWLVDRSLTGLPEVQFIKFRDRSPGLAKLIGEQLKPMVWGTWKDRFRKMSTIFGTLPPKFSSAQEELQKAQELRNKIAHGFGHNASRPRRTPWEPVSPISLDASEIEKYLIIVSQVIRVADASLFLPLIGSYEFLYEFHSWSASLPDQFTRPSPAQIEPSFRRHIAAKFGSGPGKTYYKAMIAYYEASR